MSRVIQNTNAFLIHRRTYGGNGLLIDFLTEDFGLMRCLSRQARQAKHTIQPFTRLQINFKGKSELKTLLNFEINDAPRILLGDKLILSVYANELITRLLKPLEEHKDIFIHYQWLMTALASLEKTQKKTQHWALRLFEKKLLDSLGLGLDYIHDNSGKLINTNECYYFKIESGFILAKTGDISGQLLLALQQADLKQRPDDCQLRLCRILLQTQLQPLLGNKPLKSRLLLQPNR